MSTSTRSRIDVCLASYNGHKHICEQIASILSQFQKHDEIVVVDDASIDDTILLLTELSDRRVRVIKHAHNLGVLKTFEDALKASSGDIIFLCDQDDIWLPDKIEKVMRVFSSDPSVTLVLTNGEFLDASGHPMGRMMHPPGRVPLGAVANLIRNRYQGSAMAFRRELLEAVLPFPDGIPMHDSWIGIVNAIVGRAAYIPDKLMLYRQHDNSVTKRIHGPVHRMIAQRWSLIINILRRFGVLRRIRKRLQERRWTVDSVATLLSE